LIDQVDDESIIENKYANNAGVVNDNRIEIVFKHLVYCPGTMKHGGER
jgi:hypothetical protein